MKTHVAAHDDGIWYVIIDGPIKLTKANTAAAITDGAPQTIEKQRSEWTTDDNKKTNMDNVAKDILHKILNKTHSTRSIYVPTQRKYGKN